MELEEMQAAWSQMSTELEAQKQLTNEIILKMKQQAYTSKINKVIRVERVGALICLATIIYILVNFGKFESWQSQVSAVIVMLTVGGMSIVSLQLLAKMKALNIQKDSLSTTIKKYAEYKKKTAMFQMASVILGFFVLFASAGVFSVLFGGKDIFVEVQQWEKLIPSMAIGLVVYFLIAYLGARFYGKSLHQAQDILHDLKD